MACTLLAEGLQRHSDLQVVACALNSSEFANAVKRYAPDVALISAHSEDGAPDGSEAISRIHQHHPNSRVVLLIEHSDRETVVEAFRARRQWRLLPYYLHTENASAVRAIGGAGTDLG